MKKRKSLEGTLDNIIKNEILINVNHLENGLYELKITHRNKVIAKITFKKEN